MLAQKGSLFVTRPTLFTFIADRARLDKMARELFAIVASGKVKIPAPAEAPLADAARVHAALEARQTTGAIVLTP